MLQLNSYLIQK